MKIVLKRSRYYYWVVSGFMRKYSKLMVVFFIIAFFALFFSRTFFDFFRPLFILRREKVGILRQGSIKRLPQEVLEQISTPIVRYGKMGKYLPGLAEKWEILNEGRTYVFSFPTNLRWNDGSPFVVGDIDESFINFPQVETKIENDYTLRFTLKKPLSSFLSILTTPILKTNLVGINSLYKVSRVRSEFGELKQIYLLPVSRGLPYLIYRLYNTPEDLVLAYKLGEIDQFITNNSDVLSEFKGWHNTKVIPQVNYQRIVTLFINTQKAPFDNKNLRSALALGVDYVALEKYGEKARSPILSFTWAYDPEIKELNYEPEISASVVSNNNLGDKPLTLQTSYELKRIAEVVKRSLEEAGFNIEIRYLSYIPTDYELFLTIWEPPIDPDQYVFWHQTQTQGNFSKLKNVKIDKFLEDGRNEISLSKRKQIYYKFQEVMLEELPAVFLLYPDNFLVKRGI
jgi:peptide/nickel transport system substrate-binding protein